MKSMLTLFVSASMFLVSHLHAQSFQGIAHYKTKTVMKITMDSTQVSSEMQQQINEMMKKQMEKEYTLQFDATTSTYQEDESLDAPATGGNMTFSFSSGNRGVLYRNTKEKTFAKESDLFGKPFLIKDSLKVYDWKLENESKKIGNYTCYKATFEREIKQLSFSTDKKSETDSISDKKEEVKKQTVTAWYTPEIPVNIGPSNYWGLPGLILEVNDGNTTMICDKIVLNPKEKFTIEPPKKGKEVSQAEYDKLLEEKMKEMQEMYGGGKKGKDGNTFEIRIGN